jgi:hypothetical protein
VPVLLRGAADGLLCETWRGGVAALRDAAKDAA